MRSSTFGQTVKIKKINASREVEFSSWSLYEVGPRPVRVTQVIAVINGGTRGDDCPVAVSWANTPDGPWTPTHKIVIPNGPEGAWDQFSIHDPYPLVYKGRIYLYYKSDMNASKKLIRLQGLATAGEASPGRAEARPRARPPAQRSPRRLLTLRWARCASR